ncbi:MAG TPA: hypothetical protein PKA06_10440 [Gemmatales bacterium]|nr:hypothetical protein [Gemmatales bacterium]
MKSGMWGFWIVLVLVPGCSSQPAAQEGNVKVTSTADLGQAVGAGK